MSDYPMKLSSTLLAVLPLVSQTALSQPVNTPKAGAIDLTAPHACVIESASHLLCEYLADPTGIDSTRFIMGPMAASLR